MRNLMFALAVLMIAGVAGCSQTAMAAGNIGSGASGAYAGSDRSCVVVLRAHGPGQLSSSITCLGFDAWPTSSFQTLRSDDCWTQATILLNPGSGRAQEYLSILSYTTTELRIIRGFDRTQVANGIGTTETWQRIGNAPSPSPFSCPAPQWLYKLPW